MGGFRLGRGGLGLGVPAAAGIQWRALAVAGVHGLSAVGIVLLLGGACGGRVPPPDPSPDPAAQGSPVVHRVYVANESSDLVSLVRFVPGEAPRVERQIPVGLMPSDNDGAHGVTVSPDGRFWYVTLAHGTPYGQLWKFHAGPDTLVARASLGLFPATIGISPDGAFLLAANFNLHGDMVPSDISVVHAPTMVELTRIETCLMPHGGRVDATGAKHYSACMHSDQLVEVDLGDLAVSARFLLEPGRERSLAADHAGAHGSTPTVCSPTWVEPAESGARTVYVACNRNRSILEVDTDRWQVLRRFPTGEGPYNLEATPDGRLLLATLKGEQAVAVFDLSSGVEVARVRTSRPVTHGVVSTPDSRYAFVSNESVGSTPGTVDVIDLETLERIGTADVGQQAGGIDYWGGPRRAPPRP